MAGRADKGKGLTIVLRREEVVAGGHHGGAWKVAYADFVTAMMAFFLLMWLLNATTEAQRKGLADYFSPNNLLSRASSGSGKPFGGKSPFEDGNLVSDRGAAAAITGKAQPVPDGDPATSGTAPAPSDRDQDGGAPEMGAGTAPAHAPLPPGQDNTAAAARAAAEQRAFQAAAAELKQAVAADPSLAGLADQLMVDETPRGLRIQILDREKRPMFATGSVAPNPDAQALLQRVAPVLMRLTEKMEITGHTDATPYKDPAQTNWELSAGRANATRRVLQQGGLPDARIDSVSGDADRDPLLPKDPLAAANRRITIIVLRDSAA